MFKKALTLSILMLVVASAKLLPQGLTFQSAPEKELLTNWETNKLLDRNIVECFLIAEGASDKLEMSRTWLAKLEAEAKEYIDKDDAVLKKGERLYKFLHNRVLKKFVPNADMASMLAAGQYNCVTSTALYAHMAQTVGIPVIFHATPFHVCPIVTSMGRRVWVEMTAPKNGFDIEFKREELARLLLENKYVTPEEYAQKGSEAVYNEFVHGNFRMNASSLVGYHYYNRSLQLSELGKREEAFWAVAKAEKLEQNDEMIRKVYDHEFLLLCSASEPPPSFEDIVYVYFRARGKDSTVTTDAVAAVRNGVGNLIENHRDFVRADSVTAVLIRNVLPVRDIPRSLAELRQYVSVNKGLELNRKGDYRGAYIVISDEMKNDTSNVKLQDLYVSSGLDYAQKLMNSGNDAVALAVVDSMHRMMPSYEKLKEMYCHIIISGTMLSNRYRSDPAGSRTALMKAFAMDSVNRFVREGLGAVHHELAMEQIRKSNWKAAKAQVQLGLRFVPDNESLKSDWTLLLKELPPPKKKK